MSEILRILPGSSLVVVPSDRDLASPELAHGLEESFGGGGYTALQRAALLQLAWDHVSSALDARERHSSACERRHAQLGAAGLRRNFRDYNTLANAVLGQLDLPMPKIDLTGIPAAPIAARAVPWPRPPPRSRSVVGHERAHKSFDPGVACPLDGVRVVDMSRLVSGNMISLQLADFGAEVIKIEDPKRGDPLRAWQSEGVSVHWKVYSRNKKSLALSLREARGASCCSASWPPPRC